MITVRNLRFQIGEFEILKGVDMDVAEGKFIGLIGPNGSGKSTVLKCIYQVYRDYTGEILLKDRDVLHIPHRERAKLLSVVGQFNDLQFDFTVEDMVMLGRSPYKKFMERDTAEDRKIVAEAIEKVGLKGAEKRTLSTFSGGERQRIVLARALAQQSPVMILDEPTNHLDIKYQLELLELVKSLGVTVVAALHDISLACLFCDEIYALQQGKIIGAGTPDELIDETFILNLYDVESKIVYDRELKQTGIFWKRRQI